jgi:hypothetical protein
LGIGLIIFQNGEELHNFVGTIRDENGRDTRSDKKIETIRKESQN